MRRRVVFQDCIRDWLNLGKYPEDLLRWVDQENRIFEFYFRHGNSQSHPRSQLDAAQVMLGWEGEKNRLPIFTNMSDSEIGIHLTVVRQRFRQAIKSQVESGIFIKIDLPKDYGHFERYRFSTKEEKAAHQSRGRRKRSYSASSNSSGSSCSSASSSPKHSRVETPMNISSPLEEVQFQANPFEDGHLVNQSESRPSGNGYVISYILTLTPIMSPGNVIDSAGQIPLGVLHNQDLNVQTQYKPTEEEQKEIEDHLLNAENTQILEEKVDTVEVVVLDSNIQNLENDRVWQLEAEGQSVENIIIATNENSFGDVLECSQTVSGDGLDIQESAKLSLDAADPEHNDNQNLIENNDVLNEQEHLWEEIEKHIDNPHYVPSLDVITTYLENFPMNSDADLNKISVVTEDLPDITSMQRRTDCLCDFV